MEHHGCLQAPQRPRHQPRCVQLRAMCFINLPTAPQQCASAELEQTGGGRVACGMDIGKLPAPTDKTTQFSGLTRGKCAHALVTASMLGLFWNIAPSTYPLRRSHWVQGNRQHSAWRGGSELCTGKQVVAAEALLPPRFLRHSEPLHWEVRGGSRGTQHLCTGK